MTVHRFDEQGKAEYAEEIRKRWEAGVLDDEEAVWVLIALELADEDGRVEMFGGEAA